VDVLTRVRIVPVPVPDTWPELWHHVVQALSLEVYAELVDADVPICRKHVFAMARSNTAKTAAIKNSIFFVSIFIFFPFRL
jgi:hypothetical protein